jgi:hypothetical protein
MGKIMINGMIIITIIGLSVCSKNKNQQNHNIEEDDYQQKLEIEENYSQINKQFEIENEVIEFKMEDYVIAETHDFIGNGNIGIIKYQYEGNMPDIEIPSIIRGSNVTEIEGFNDKELRSIIIPNSVNRIGNWAFSNNNLTNITIPNSVRSIMDRAFYNNHFTNIVIPTSVKYIGLHAFAKNELISITIGGNVNLAWTSYGKEGEAFDNDFDEFYEKNGSKEGTYIYVNDKWKIK